MDDKLKKIKEIVEKELTSSAHDIDHMHRVYNLVIHLAKGENVDLDVLKAAVLLHDIARVHEEKDKRCETDHAVLGAEMAVPILQELNYSDDKIKHIQDCILSHRHRSGTTPQTKEAQILSDADNLDIMGASGIARMFGYVGKHKQKIYKDVPLGDYIKENLTGNSIKGRIIDYSKHSPILEFKIKVKNLPEKLYTKKAKEIAKQRIKFMESFFERLKKEIKGEL